MKPREQFASELAEINAFYEAEEGLQRPGGMVRPRSDQVTEADIEAMGAWGYDLLAGRTVPEVKYAICNSEEWRTKHPEDPTNPYTPAPTAYGGRLTTRDRQFVTTATGERVGLVGISSFKLLALLHAGRTSEVIAVLDWAAAHQINLVRVFLGCWHLFPLHPHDGLQQLPVLTRLARERGIYVYLSVFVDTKDHPALAAWTEGHFKTLLIKVNAFALTIENLLIEGGNELAPLHPTQSETARDVALEAAGWSWAVPYVPGSTHDGGDESLALSDGHFLDAHFLRDLESDRGWKVVRHVKEGWTLSVDTDKPLMNGEPRRAGDQDPSPARWFASGVLDRLFGFGTIFHFPAGRHSGLPEDPAVAACFDAWQFGLQQLPPDWDGWFYNLGATGSPCVSADVVADDYPNGACVRLYSSVQGSEAWAIAIGCIRDPKPHWDEGWQVGSLYSFSPEVLLYHLFR